MGEKKQIGLLTSGGDAPGLNAVIRGAVKSANQLDYDCVGFLRGYEGLIDPVSFIPLTHQNTTGILNQGGTILGTTNRGRFSFVEGPDGRPALDPELVEAVGRTVERLDLAGLICVGGDGSLAIAQELFEAGIPVVGVPKTIDNDLSATVFTFGFDSAVDCATDALDRLHTTAASHERIMVLEVMGRHAGWIALYAGIAGGGDVILIPEIPWTFDNICHKILDRDAKGKKFTLVVVAEGATLPTGEVVGASPSAATDATFDWGVSAPSWRRKSQDDCGETRCVVLGHLQRGGAQRRSIAYWPRSLAPMRSGSCIMGGLAKWFATNRRISAVCRSQKPSANYRWWIPIAPRYTPPERWESVLATSSPLRARSRWSKRPIRLDAMRRGHFVTARDNWSAFTLAGRLVMMPSTPAAASSRARSRSSTVQAQTRYPAA